MITIIDYKMGNVRSVQNALDSLGYRSEITADTTKIRQSDYLILPGVGAAGEAMKNLQERNLIEAINEHVSQNKPLLGICLGMQILFEYSEENNTNCLGLIQGKVRKFPTQTNLKIPHIGWNRVDMRDQYQDQSGDYYFVHSYYCDPGDNGTVGKTSYGISFTSMIQQNSIIACQFHPEKSGTKGLALLDTILKSP
jgi:glutamine amidotransferase